LAATVAMAKMSLERFADGNVVVVADFGFSQRFVTCLISRKK
jgi:hypothetical protein